MSVSLYDKALKNKLQNWIKDENLKITSPNETRRLFEYTADVNNDNLNINSSWALSLFWLYPRKTKNTNNGNNIIITLKIMFST